MQGEFAPPGTRRLPDDEVTKAADSYLSMVLKNDTPDAVNSSVRWGTTGTWASFRLAPGESRIHWLKNPTGNPGVAVYYDADLRPGRDRFETHAGATYGVTDVRKGWPVRFIRTNGNTTIFLAK